MCPTAPRQAGRGSVIAQGGELAGEGSVLLASAVLAQADTDPGSAPILRNEFEAGGLKSVPDSGLVRDRDAEGTFLHFRSAHGGDPNASGISDLLGGPAQDGAGGAKLLTCDCQIIT